MSIPVRLSESPLWQEVREFYKQQGEAAWTSGAVPFFATNNPAIAKTYVDLFLAFIDDCLSRDLIDRDQPLFILELGGGLGRLAYLILVRLQNLADGLPVKVKYLLTDYAQTNVSYYQNHERLQPFLESGLLEISQLDAETGLGLETEIKNPPFVIANYLFDTLSHDGFRIREGKLYEALCEKVVDGDIIFSYQELVNEAYENEEFHAILDHYAQTLGDTHIPFPIGPLRCLNSLTALSEGRFALVMADKGLRSMEELLDFASLPLQRHDSGFSMSVNCHAIDTIWKRSDGTVLHSSPRENSLNIALYIKGLGEKGSSKTKNVFEDQINGFGPLDYLSFRSGLIQSITEMPLSLCLQLLRLSYFDAELLYELSNQIGSLSLDAPIHTQREVYDVLTRCWGNFFSIADGRDVPFAVARTLACINQFQQAIGFYGESLRLYGERAETYQNIAICQFNLEQFGEAEKSANSALKVDPQSDASKSLLVRISEVRERENKLTL